MKDQINAARIEAEVLAPCDDATAGVTTVHMRGRVIPHPDGLLHPRFALRAGDGTTIGLSGVDADADSWLLGAHVEIEGRYESASILKVCRIKLATQ